jgi:hypothetical protein
MGGFEACELSWACGLVINTRGEVFFELWEVLATTSVS